MHEYMPKRRLRGGIRLQAQKEESTATPIRRGLSPSRVTLSCRQGQGPAAIPIVSIGQQVLRGEVVAAANSLDSTSVHASTSGTVVAIQSQLVPFSTQCADALCIVIEADGAHKTGQFDQATWPADKAEQLARIADAGIVGFGGAAFPTARKLKATGCETLLINGAECEPYISCDDLLMRESAVDIIAGARIIAALAGASRTIIAIERDKPQALESIKSAMATFGDDSIEVAELPSIYPAGGERQLIEVLAGIEVPASGYPTDVGFICNNVGTAYAIQRLAQLSEPVLSRVVTVTGNAVRNQCNVDVPIGTSVAEVVAYCGGHLADAARLIHGGSMMGYALPNDSLPITKSTTCLIVARAAEVRVDYSEWPCIRCGECTVACPVRLQPQDLLVAARASEFAALDILALVDCIECGCCDVVCPSQIPLTEVFREAKQALGTHSEEQCFSAESDLRFQRREFRQQDAVAAVERRQQSLKVQVADPDSRSGVIAAAVARSRKRRLPGGDESK
jgi:electron transport complex protein RnfC